MYSHEEKEEKSKSSFLALKLLRGQSFEVNTFYGRESSVENIYTNEIFGANHTLSLHELFHDFEWLNTSVLATAQEKTFAKS